MLSLEQRDIYLTRTRLLSCVYIESGAEKFIQPVHVSCPVYILSLEQRDIYLTRTRFLSGVYIESGAEKFI